MTDDIQRRITELREELKAVDSKLDAHALDAAGDRANLTHVREQVDTLSRVLLQGNGNPSLTTQVSDLYRDVDNFDKRLREQHTTLSEIHQHVRSLDARWSDMTQVKEAKWKVYGKIAGIVSLALPGLLSFLGFAP